MPEEITEQPANYDFITENPQPSFTNKLSKRVVDSYEAQSERIIVLPYETVMDIIAGVRDEIANKYPALQKHEIEELLGMYFGAYALDRETLNKTYDPAKQTISAAIQHSQAHGFFYAGLGKANPEYLRKMFDTAVTHDNLSRAADGEGISIQELGIQSELGVMRILHNLKCKVYLPEYSSKGRSNEDEVRKWDVENNCDMVAVRVGTEGNVVFLVNAQGEYYHHGDRSQGFRTQPDVEPELVTNKEFVNLSQTLQQHIRSLNPVFIYRLTVTIPTHPDHLMTLRAAYQEWNGDKVQALRHYCEPSESVEQKVGSSIARFLGPIPVAA